MRPWIQLSEAQAEAHPSFGRGGLVGLFLILLGLLQVGLAVQIDWAGLSDPLFFSLVGVFALAATTFAFGLTFSTPFPRLGSMLALVAAGITATVGVLIAVSGPGEVSHAFVSLGASLGWADLSLSDEERQPLAFGLIGAGAVLLYLAAYLRLSRRVNVTYLSRVRRGDPFLLKLGL